MAEEETSELGSSEEVLELGSLGGLKVYRAGDIELPERALIYGSPGAGKTPFIASAHRVAAFHPLLLIDCDQGPKSIRRSFPGVRVVSPTTLLGLERILDSLLGGKHRDYKSVCVDGMSTVQQMGYAWVLGENGKYQSFTNFEGPSWKNHGYQISAMQMTIMMRKLKALPTHVFVTAWDKDVSNPDDPLPKLEPSFTPAVSDAIDGAFDSVLYLGEQSENGTPVTYLRTRSSVNVFARDRDGRLPETIRNPTMQILAKHWGLDHSVVESG
jgi:hypothetical protein